MYILALQDSMRKFKQEYNSFQMTLRFQSSVNQKITTIEKMGIPLGQKIADLRQKIETVVLAGGDPFILIGCSQELDKFQSFIQTNLRIVTKNLLSGDENERGLLLERIKAATPACLNQYTKEERQNITHVFEALKKYSEFDSALTTFNTSLEKDSTDMLIAKLQKSLEACAACKDFMRTHPLILTANVLQDCDLKEKFLEEKFALTQSKGLSVIDSLHVCLGKLELESTSLQNKKTLLIKFATVLDQALRIFPDRQEAIVSLKMALDIYKEELSDQQEAKLSANDFDFA